MMKYQIRLPEDMILEDLLVEMAMKGWLLVRDKLDTERLTHEIYMQFAEQIRSSLMSHLISRDQKERELILEHRKHTWDLYVITDFDQFTASIAFEAFKAIQEILKPGLKQSAIQALTLAFESVIGEYLYSTPVLGQQWKAWEPLFPVGPIHS